mmetsp:Transcript_33601/g.107052  ORF Transcript_33601/g.107052 Transcript_33601/m.107052 type:complete len:298 (+) Transcript_33601:3-896(+)
MRYGTGFSSAELSAHAPRRRGPRSSHWKAHTSAPGPTCLPRRSRLLPNCSSCGRRLGRSRSTAPPPILFWTQCAMRALGRKPTGCRRHRTAAWCAPRGRSASRRTPTAGGRSGRRSCFCCLTCCAPAAPTRTHWSDGWRSSLNSAGRPQAQSATSLPVSSAECGTWPSAKEPTSGRQWLRRGRWRPRRARCSVPRRARLRRRASSPSAWTRRRSGWRPTRPAERPTHSVEPHAGGGKGSVRWRRRPRGWPARSRPRQATRCARLRCWSCCRGWPPTKCCACCKTMRGRSSSARPSGC